MPPKPKYTKEEIVSAAYELAREKGMDSVVAREVGNKLGTSASPIFTIFSSMEELKSEVRNMALEEFNRRTDEAMKYVPAFKQFGKLMVEFARTEPQLFRLLFMQEHAENSRFEDIVPELGAVVQKCIGVIEVDYGLARDKAGLLFNQLWIYTYGICVMCANRVCSFRDDELDRLLGMQFVSTSMLIISGNADMKPVSPTLKMNERT